MNSTTHESHLLILWLTADHPSQDGKAVAAIEKITSAGTDLLSDYLFKKEVLGGSNGANIEFIGPTNDDFSGKVALNLNSKRGGLRSD